MDHNQKEPINREYVLVEDDRFMLLADYTAYLKCQQKAARVYGDMQKWTQMSILNVSRIGKFLSERAVREYCRDIWKAHRVPVRLDYGDL